MMLANWEKRITLTLQAKKTLISEPVTENVMLPEVRDFARVINEPGNIQNQTNLRWLNLSVQVNKMLFNLRQSGKIVFYDERDN